MRLSNRALLSFAIAVLASVAGHAQTLPQTEYVCNFGNPDPVDRKGQSTLYRCRPVANNKAPVVNVAVLKGTPAEVNRAHGYLLAREAEAGPLSEAIDLVESGISGQNLLLRPTLRSVVSCFSNKLFASLNSEFQANVAAFEGGYRQRLGAKAKYRLPQLRLASVGIELDNIMTAVGHRHGRIGQMLVAEKNCPGGLLLKVILNGGLKLVGRDKGLGCTSFAVPGRGKDGAVLSREGLLFGRTLDAELVRSWNRVPTLFTVHEYGRDGRGRPYLPYVAAGSAGLIYAGGISGFNTEGIAVSLHQMYASDAVLSVPAGQARKAALAPVIVKTVLREARSIDDAVIIAKRYQAIATWTILIADAKTGEAGAIEITKGGVKLVRRTKHQPLAQTNHVFDRKQRAYAFFPNYNKYNETHTRMAVLEKAFARLQERAATGHPFDAAQAVAQLANHEDINGRFQPFGTTSVKPYDVMSAVMLPEARKFYMSVGDFAPSPHATFLGFQLDEDLNPVGAAGTLRDQSLAATPGVLQSLNDYVRARLAYEARDYAGAERHLRQAIAHAAGPVSNSPGPVWEDRRAGSLRIYNYILARLLAIKATQTPYGGDRSREARRAAYRESRERFRAVIEDPGEQPYQRALAEYHYGLTELKFEGGRFRRSRLSPETAALVGHALGVFQSQYQKLKSSVEIKEMADNVANAQKILGAVRGKSLMADDIDWVVIR